MQLLTLEQYTKNFFEKERTKLEKNYPGISLNRILAEIKSSSYNNQLNPKEISRNIFFNLTNDFFSKFFKELELGKPLEYIRKRAFFYRSDFYVNEDVLIPRSESEILVEHTCNYINSLKAPQLSVCEVGVGSGALIISIMNEIDNKLTCTATDISPKALSVAKRNYFFQRFKINKNSSLKFIETDRLLNIDDKFDIIISNPPYIKTSLDISTVHEQVTRFEPHIALFIEDEKYDLWFEQFFKQIESSLKDNGFFMMEGHEDHLENLKKILEKLNFENIEIIKDYTDRKRFIKGYKKCKN